MNTERKVGYYFVDPHTQVALSNLKEHVGYWNGYEWQVIGFQGYFTDHFFTKIDERPITRQESAPTENTELDKKTESEIMIQAFEKVKKLFNGYSWIKEGRGPYAYDDDGYRKEITYLYNEFDSIVREVTSGIKSKYIDFRNEVISDYLKDKEKFSIEIKQISFPPKINRAYLKFTIGVQTFSLHDCEDLQHAEWLKTQLSHALNQLGKEVNTVHSEKEKDFYKCPSCGEDLRIGLSPEAKFAFERSAIFKNQGAVHSESPTAMSLTIPVAMKQDYNGNFYIEVGGAKFVKEVSKECIQMVGNVEVFMCATVCSKLPNCKLKRLINQTDKTTRIE